MSKLGALLGALWQLIARRIDSYLMAAALAIAGVGMITLVSASDQSVARLSSQALSLGFALVLMWAVANIAPQRLARVALPLYVLAVEAASGRVVVGPRAELERRTVWIAPGRLLTPSRRVQAKLRYRTDPVWATVRPGVDGFTLDLDEAVSGIAPGQTAVLYDDDTVVGTGTIAS
jgi:hypothetical protein